MRFSLFFKVAILVLILGLSVSQRTKRRKKKFANDILKDLMNEINENEREDSREESSKKFDFRPDSSFFVKAPKDDSYSTSTSKEKKLLKSKSKGPSNKLKSKKSQKKKSNQSSKTKQTQNTQNSNLFSNLESQLSDNLRSQAQKTDENAYELQLKLYKFKLPRKLAYPVEDILKKYQDLNTDLYSVLGVGKNANDAEIKKAYRSKALIIHPDKNPHPDSKAAFDGLQDAFDVLSSPHRRADYDKELLKISKSKQVTLLKFIKKAKEWVFNLQSQYLLCYYQWKRGEEIEEFTNLKKFFIEYKDSIKDFQTHLALLPSFEDRIHLIGESIIKQKYTLLLSTLVFVKLFVRF